MSDNKKLTWPEEMFASINMVQVKLLAEKGCTDKFMADFFGVTLSVWQQWKSKHYVFKVALKTWKDVADEKVEKSLYEKACGYSHPEEKIFVDKGDVIKVQTVRKYAPDTGACSLWLTNRKPEEWCNTIKHDVKGKVDHNVNGKVTVAPVNLEERIKQIVSDKLKDALQ